MPFAPGSIKPANSGRKKGVPAKRTSVVLAPAARSLAPLVATRLAELNCDPIEKMVRMALNSRTEPAIRARLYIELAQYVYPKRRAIEHSGVIGGTTIDINVTARDVLIGRIAGIAARLPAPADNPEPE